MSDVETPGTPEEVPVSEGGEEGQPAGTVTPPAEPPSGPSEVPDTQAHVDTDTPAQTKSEIHGRATEDKTGETQGQETTE